MESIAVGCHGFGALRRSAVVQAFTWQTFTCGTSPSKPQPHPAQPMRPAGTCEKRLMMRSVRDSGLAPAPHRPDLDRSAGQEGQRTLTLFVSIDEWLPCR